MSTPSLGQGCLLVASPELIDPNFVRSVVFVITHDESGSFGLVLNRPLDVVLADVLEDVGAAAGAVPVLRGGPVQPEVLQFLSAADGPGRALLPGVTLGGPLDHLLGLAQGGGAVRAYAGYAGWSGGQLERETQEGSWIVAPARAAHVFEIPAAQLWARVLRQLGGRYAWLALEGGKPDVN
ncbi:MAG: YqgE/AlgH family protein [Planctomycetes bacterium]|nr:YqgE/AlgH family protein [Planctomycetota bacterium]